MMCSCHDRPDYVDIAIDDSPSFEEGFVTLERHADVELRQCQECGEHWQVDIGRGGLAIRVANPKSWSEFDDRPVRLQQLVDFHGGVREGVCQWSGCERQPLRGMVFCPHHAYPMLSDELNN